MRVLFRRAMRSDPSMYIASFGIFAIICGFNLLMPGNTFDYSPAWDRLRDWHANDTAWGVLMLLDGLMMIISIRMRAVPWRAAIIGLSGLIWIFLGATMVISAYRQGITTIIGMYAIAGAIGCVIALEQLLHYPADEAGHGHR
jgi:hypothetical protein